MSYIVDEWIEVPTMDEVKDIKFPLSVVAYVEMGCTETKDCCAWTRASGVSALDRNRQLDFHIRLFFDDVNKEAIAKWRLRLNNHNLTVERQTERAIDAVGTRSQIEQALQVTIEEGPNGPVLESNPNSVITKTLPPMKAYIPRRPTLF